MKRLQISLDARAYETETAPVQANGGYSVQLRAPGHLAERRVRVLRGAPDALLLVDDRVVSVSLGARSADLERALVSLGTQRRARFGALPPPRPSGSDRAPQAALTSPMPGRVVQVAVQAGDLLEKGQLLLVIEAMKMQNELSSPASARVRAVHVSEGDTLERGALLLEFD
jgi:biotin carboxyl carrier protein